MLLGCRNENIHQIALQYLLSIFSIHIIMMKELCDITMLFLGTCGVLILTELKDICEIWSENILPFSAYNGNPCPIWKKTFSESSWGTLLFLLWSKLGIWEGLWVLITRSDNNNNFQYRILISFCHLCDYTRNKKGLILGLMSPTPTTSLFLFPEVSLQH